MRHSLSSGSQPSSRSCIWSGCIIQSRNRTVSGEAVLLFISHNFQKDVVGNIHLATAEFLPALFAFLLLFKELHFAGNIAAVEIASHVLASRRFASRRDDTAHRFCLDLQYE